ncbi:MAG: NAD-dependent succinate-semialdehyde dehydrogenase [Patescibacteria group bacterium]
MKSINPATEEVIKEYQTHSDTQVADILRDVDKAQKDWARRSYGERAELFHEAAKYLREHAEEYARLMAMEMGKVLKEGRAEVEKCAYVCEYYADNAAKFLAPEEIKTENSKSYVRFDPLGIIFAVMPWNFPLWQVFRGAAPALMAGNSMALKHASNVAGSALAVEEIFIKAGFPENLFRTLLITSGQVENVIRNPLIAAVTLTGSEGAGSAVAKVAGECLKKTVLELGGSDPFIVLADADVDLAVSGAAQGRMLNSGQSCIAAKRFIVNEAVADEFETKLVEHFRKLKVGDPLEESSQVGPLARVDLLHELHQQVEKSLAQGAVLATGGRRIGGVGAYYEPTILTGVTEDMAVFREETFGPVVAVIRVANDEEAERLANLSHYGLGASIWTRSIEHAEKVASRIEAGLVAINKVVRSDPRLPFGGVKKSGYGRELSHYGIKEFVNIKTVVVG